EWADQVRQVATRIAAVNPETDTLFEHDPHALAVTNQVRGIANQYLGDFETVARAAAAGTDPRSHALTATLTGLGPQMFELYGQLSSQTHAKQNELGPRIAEQEALQLTILVIISAVGLLIGLALAIVTGRWLNGTFANLTGTMAKLTDGNYDIEIQGTQTQNELGEMARALETFRVNGINVQLAEEEKQARANDIAARADMMARFQGAFDGVIEKAIAGDF